ncbi:carbohydrate-binding protein [Granulicella sp. S156]|uniref:carbohydrate-binding protein n=1 Tax=Granulicella sp. S156 TaxID=1747224 RepID=UPI00131C3DA4|nr:carbohydrate-binding protein [Granulicella sp. S156]
MKFRFLRTPLADTLRDSKTNVCLVVAILFIPFVLSVCSQGVVAQTVAVVQTNPDQSALLTPQTPLTFTHGTASETAINVDDTIHYQQLEGVGASFNDSDAYLVWNKLTPAQRTALMKDLFSPDGIHLSYLRQSMGGNDLSLSSYTYDDMPSGETDPQMKRFSIAHDQAYIIPTIKSAFAANPDIKVQALPWSPPAWMKTTGTLDGGSLNTENFPALALYFSKFIQAYEAQGIPINYVSVQNEPLNETSGYPSMFMNPHDEGQFIAQYLGPQLRNLHLRNQGWNFARQAHDPTDATPGIFGYEHNWDNPKYPETLAEDPTVRQYLAGVSFHCYAGNVADAQNALHDLAGDVPIYFTECTGGTYAPYFGQNLANDTEGQVIDVLRNWGKTVVFWNLALDQNSGPTDQNGCNDCRGVVTIDDSTTPAVVSRNVEYYVLGHLSKYVQAGAYRIDSNTFGSGNVEDVAFKNPDGSIAVLVFNGAQTPSQFSLNWKGETVSYTLPAQAVATFSWQGYKGNTFDVTAGPGSQTVAPGGHSFYSIDVNHYGNDHGNVELKVEGLPGGAFGEPVPIPFTNQYLLPVFTEASATSGSYPITFLGRQGNATASSTVNFTVGGEETPFPAGPAAIPGLIQAENFDKGGNYVGYFNLDTTDQGSAPGYRPGTTVGIENTGDVGGGYDVGYTGEGEYLRYTVNVATPGIYNLQSRVASLGQGGYFHVSFDDENKTGTLFVPVTNGFQTFTTQVSPAFQLAAGRHVMQVTLDSNGPTGGMGNFNWFAVQAPTPSSSFTGSPQSIPGLIQVENFDTGGKGVAYWNGATANGGGANYRPGETVYIENSSDTGGGYDVGNPQPGDWLNYTVDIASARTYTLQVRVANGVGGGVFHLNVDGQQVTQHISVPETGGYQTWQTLTIPDVPLPEGIHTVQLVMDSGGFYNAVGNFNWFSLN